MSVPPRWLVSRLPDPDVTHGFVVPDQAAGARPSGGHGCAVPCSEAVRGAVSGFEAHPAEHPGSGAMEQLVRFSWVLPWGERPAVRNVICSLGT
jgi:hypothetical protein